MRARGIFRIPYKFCADAGSCAGRRWNAKKEKSGPMARHPGSDLLKDGVASVEDVAVGKTVGKEELVGRTGELLDGLLDEVLDDGFVAVDDIAGDRADLEADDFAAVEGADARSGYLGWQCWMGAQACRAYRSLLKMMYPAGPLGRFAVTFSTSFGVDVWINGPGIRVRTDAQLHR